MAVIINEFEVITEPPRASSDPSAPPTTAPQPPPPVTPDVILSIMQREFERCSRVRAG
jgi:hypothetical protein